MSRSREYCSWLHAKQRCYWLRERAYPNYGGRGIQMCERWRNDFAAFLKDMGPRPPGLTLERNNVHGHYEPSNCRWATRLEQARNKRTSKRMKDADATVYPLMEEMNADG